MCPHAQIREDKRKIRCVLVHDHILLRQGLRRLLEDEPDIEVVTEAGNAAEALRTIFEQGPEVVITEARIFECGPAQAERLILQESPATKVLFLALDDGDDLHGHALGRASYAVRQTSAAELVGMVRQAATPQGTFAAEMRPSDLAEVPIDELLPKQRILTTREREVLKLLAEGRTVRSVASILGLSIKTVDAHKFNLMRKLGIHNKAELVMWAIQKRVVKLPVNF